MAISATAIDADAGRASGRPSVAVAQTSPMARRSATAIQHSGRSRVSLLEMYRLDVAYAAQAPLRTDLRILLRTVPVVLGRDGAA
jgi:hypothetical protein